MALSGDTGVRRESSLHRALKFRYAGQDGLVEACRGSYVCDGVNSAGEAIEVQTGSFGPLREKVPNICQTEKLTIVHPIIIRKFISSYDAGGNFLGQRKSPRRGSPWDLFRYLVYAPLLPKTPGLTILLALVDVEEKRVSDGKGSWRRKGVSIMDKAVLVQHGEIRLQTPHDWGFFLPFGCGETFTAKALASRTGIKPPLARKALYVLSRLGLAVRTGKEGKAYTYNCGPGW
jgi:hypothetical protein